MPWSKTGIPKALRCGMAKGLRAMVLKPCCLGVNPSSAIFLDREHRASYLTSVISFLLLQQEDNAKI
jgi:hypothetical protein